MDIQDQSFIISIVIIMVPFIIISVTGMAISRKLINHHPLFSDAELRGLATISSVIGGLFGLMLGLMVVSLWQDYKSFQTKTIEEAASIGILYAEAEQLDGESADSLQMLTEEYLDAIIHDAWPLMEKGEDSKITPVIFAKLLTYALDISSDKTDGKEYIRNDIVERLVNLSTIRKERIFYTTTPRVPPHMWIVLIIGAILTISSTFLFPVLKTKSQILLTILHSAMIGLIVFLIICLDYPFRGAISIGPEPYIRTKQSIERLKKVDVSVSKTFNVFF